MSWRWLALLAAGTASACAWSGTQRHGLPQQAALPIVWPAPPAQARIRFIQAVARPEDLGIRGAFLQRLVAHLAGANQAGGFIRPTGVAATDGRLYIADPGAQALWLLDLHARRARRLSAAGRERLVSPVAVAISAQGGVYLADSYLAKLFLFDAAGRFVRIITAPGLQRPAGVAYDPSRDRLYVADSATHQVWIFSGEGALRGTIGRRGAEPGAFNFPTHVALDQEGQLYVTDALGFRVQVFDSEGRVTRQYGRHGDASGDFASPKGIAVDSEGHLYVADALFDAVQLFDRSNRLLLTVGQRGAKPGEFSLPNGLCIDAQDRIYVADAYNHRIQIFSYVPERATP